MNFIKKNLVMLVAFLIENYKFIRILLLIFVIYLYYIGLITNERILRFTIILIIIYLYLVFSRNFTRIVNLIISHGFFKKYINIRWEERKKDLDFRRKIKFLNIIVKIMYFLTIISNPLLYIYIHVYVRLFYFFRWINWKIEDWKKLRRLIYVVIIDFIMFPPFIVWLFLYKIIIRWKRLGMINIFFKRLEGFIFSILILTNFIEYFIKNIGIINLILIFYFCLVIISVKKNWFKKYSDIDLTLFGLLRLRSSIDLLNIHGELELLTNNISRLGERTISNYYVLNNFNIDILKRVELNFWLFDYESIQKEIKYKPSFFVYNDFYTSLIYILPYTWFNKMWGYKQEKNKLYFKKVWELTKQDMKKLLFKIWEMESYLGFNENYKKYLFVKLDRSIEYGHGLYKPELKQECWNIEDKPANFWEFSENLEEFIDIALVFDKDYINEAYIMDKDILNSNDEEDADQYMLGLVRSEEVEKKKLKFDEAYTEEMTTFLEECKREWEEKNFAKNKID